MGLFAQIQAFLLTSILGIIASLIFHYYQQTIRSMRVGRNSLYVMDIILWMIMIIVIAAALLIINQGEIRVYVFIALFVGGLVYYKWLAQYMRPPLVIMGRSTACMLKAIYSTMTKPFILLRGWLRIRAQRLKEPPPDEQEPPPDDFIE
ncbi:MAG: spore cortex biosynthesis protein YabQ [Syntrophomonadaceae bacterium]|nr:spore cortex biosynthesis protein YabQ [Syntrophomonadaceae bacterium]